MNGKGCDPLLNVRYRPAPANDKSSSVPRTLCNIVVMEYLDKGNLLQVRLETVCRLQFTTPGRGAAGTV